MKVALCLSLVAGTAAFSQPEASRRDAFAAAAAAVTAFVPVAAQAAQGESPRFSVFGIIGDGTSYSEGGAYGSDQSTKTYSPYSVYGNVDGKDSLYNPDLAEYKERKTAVIAESTKRLVKLAPYIEKKQWFNVIDELDRYMYETRGAVRGLSKTVEQKEAAANFFKAIEQTNLNARLKKQEKCLDAAADAIVKFDAFKATL